MRFSTKPQNTNAATIKPANAIQRGADMDDENGCINQPWKLSSMKNILKNRRGNRAAPDCH
jgi:hypothetical protein